MPVDHFPSTHATWIEQQLTLAEGGDGTAGSGPGAAASSARAALRAHLMERYYAALCTYVRTGALMRL